MDLSSEAAASAARASVNNLEWPVQKEARTGLSRAADGQSRSPPFKPLTRTTRPPAVVSTVTSDRAAVQSFVTPAAPHSSQVFSQPTLRLAEGSSPIFPPVHKAVSSGEWSQHHACNRLPVSISELRPAPSGSAFKSAMFIRTIPLPALHPAPPVPLHTGVRHVNMYKERYLPTPTCSSSPFVDEDPYRSRLMPATQQLLGTSQAARLYQHQVGVDRSRWLQRTREHISHRTPLGYSLGGEHVQLRKRYEVSEADLHRLRQLQKAKALYYGKGIRGSSRATRAEMLLHGADSLGRNDSSTRRALSNVEQQGRDEELPESPYPFGGNESPTATKQEGAQKIDTADAEDGCGSNTAEEGAAVRTSPAGHMEDNAVGRDKEESDKAAELKSKGPSIMVSKAAPPKGLLSLAELFLGQTNGKTEDLPVSFISGEQERLFGAKFDTMDTDGDGKISFDDLEREMIGSTSDEDVRSLMEVFDLNNDRMIDRREFIAVVALNEHIQGLRTKSVDDLLQLNLSQLTFHIHKFKELFRMADDSSNGRVEIAELVVMLSAAFGLEAGFDHARVNAIMTTIDRDKNGTIEFVEFLSFVPFFLRLQKESVRSPLSLDHDIVKTAKQTIERRQSKKNFK